MTSTNWVTTSIESTSVNDGVSCRFMSKKDINLVLVKHNRIEIYSVRYPTTTQLLPDETYIHEKPLVLEKKYFVKDKITSINVVRPNVN